jgi:HSP20 family protein
MAGLIPWKRRNEEKGGSALAERPHDVLSQMRRELDSLFERFFTGWPTLAGNDWPVTGWSFDVDDAEKEIVVHAEAPGFEADDFNIEIVGDNLVMKAERKEEEKGENGYHFRQERFYRTVSLPHGVEAEKIDARYHNGVLEIRIPKGEEAKGRQIPVKSA